MLLDGTMDLLMEISNEACGEFLDNQQPLIKHMTEEKYDVAFSEFIHACQFGIFHKIGVHTKLATSAFMLTPAFIIHCGMNSLNEVARAGVPLIGIPLFADQLYDAAAMKHKNFGIYVDILETHKQEVIISALDQVLNNPTYSYNAKLIQKKLNNAPFSSLLFLANQIHISGTTNHFLTNIIGGYVTESRGELIIKGKGVMETFFLISKIENAQEHTAMYGHFKESHAGDNVH
ncbi:UDP-glucoronosyl and UDP-glucosyl transferase domain-containing protein [Ditylenchus destructor]|nr:UDP-glucoronosyl and UDP-glucosyl transferase domain-containing protein [Ditylenchus destructor]